MGDGRSLGLLDRAGGGREEDMGDGRGVRFEEELGRMKLLGLWVFFVIMPLLQMQQLQDQQQLLHM